MSVTQIIQSMDEAKRAGLCFMCRGEKTLRDGHYDIATQAWVETPKKCQYCRGTGQDINKQIDYTRVREEIEPLTFSELVREGARLYFLTFTKDTDGQSMVRTFEEGYKCDSIESRLHREFGVAKHAVWLWFRRIWLAGLIANCTPPRSRPIESGLFKGYYDTGVIVWYQALKKALRRGRLNRAQRARVVMEPRVQACEEILMKIPVGGCGDKYLSEWSRLKV